MKRGLTIFGTAIILLIGSKAPTVLAHSLEIWPTSGPSAGAIKFGMDFSDANPDIIYVDGYKSIDGGTSWKKMNLPEGTVNNIAVDPDDADIVYLAMSFRLYKSTNGGILWKKIGSMGTEDSVVSAIAINPANTKEIFVGNTHGKLFFSDNSGSSWNEVSQRLGVTSPISRIAFNPKNAQDIYISTGSWYLSSLVARPKIGEGLFRSINGGETFEKLPNEFSNFLVQDVDVLGSIVYVLTRNDPDGANNFEGLFKSEDSGNTWKKLIDKRYHSFDFAIGGINHITVNPSNENQVVVSISSWPNDKGKEVSFLVSYDGGETWKESTEMEPIQYTHELKMVDNNRVYAQDYYRPFMKSADGGKTWEWSANGIRDSRIHSLEIHPTNRNLLFAGTTDGALHVSYDGGKIWKRIATKLSATYISSIKFHPADSESFYYGVSSGSDQETGRHIGAPGGDTGLYTTNDGGKTVKKMSGLESAKFGRTLGVSEQVQLEVYDILVHPSKPNIILVGTAADGVFRSEDAGKTWQEANNGMPQEGFYWNVNFDGPEMGEEERRCKEGYEKGIEVSNACFYYATKTSMNLFVNPHNENEVWYTTLEGTFVSHDLGKTWQWLSDDLRNIHTHFMAFDPSDKNIIYVGTHQGAIDKKGNVIDSSRGLLISRDAGRTWKQVSANGPGQGRDIRAIAVNPKNTNFIAVGTNEDFYVSEDKGRTWERIELEGVTGVDEIRIDNTAKVIYLGTGTSGVWRGIIDYSSSLPAIVEITGVSMPSSVKKNEEFEVMVSADNLGGRAGIIPIKLEVAGQESSRTFNLGTADQATTKFNLKLGETGKYKVLLNGFDYGEISAVGVPKTEEKKSVAVTIPKTEEKEDTINQTQEFGTELEENVEEPKRNFLQRLIEAITSFFRSLFGINSNEG